MTKTTATQIRTGHVITTDYGRPHTLEVAYVVRDLFVNPEGARLDRIRFSGWDECGTWREASFGVGADHRVYVLDDLREWPGRAFGALGSGQAFEVV